MEIRHGLLLENYIMNPPEPDVKANEDAEEEVKKEEEEKDEEEEIEKKN